MPSRRILITGLSTHWGGRLPQALEADERVEAVIGVDRSPPKVELNRAEFVQVADSHSLIRRIVDAAEIDTVVDTRLVVDSIVTTPRRAHENNVVGTLNVLAACSGPDSPVRKVVFRSSAHWYGCAQDDPAFFTEDMGRKHPPGTGVERDVVDAERSVADFAARHPGVTVTVLRFADGLGPDVRTSWTRLFGLPVVPMILGFDPRLQFIHQDDIVGCLQHAVRHDVAGVHNCAADGVLALSEVAGLLGKTYAPVLPPWGTGLAAAAVRRLGLVLPPEMLCQIRFGRGLDNRRFKAAGYRYAHTTRETVGRFGEHLRLQPLRRSDTYRYERELEDFLRYSPSVRGNAARVAESVAADAGHDAGREESPRDDAAAAASGAPGYDDLRAEEVIALLPSL